MSNQKKYATNGEVLAIWVSGIVLGVAISALFILTAF